MDIGECDGKGTMRTKGWCKKAREIIRPPAVLHSHGSAERGLKACTTDNPLLQRRRLNNLVQRQTYECQSEIKQFKQIQRIAAFNLSHDIYTKSLS
jgi:hypothetical protein